MQIIGITLFIVMGLVILFMFIGSQTIDSYEPPKSKPEPKAKLPRARIRRG